MHPSKVSLVLALLVCSACGDDTTPVVDGGASDGSQAADGSEPRIDGGPACQGISNCDSPGTHCDEESLVTCAPNPMGCLVETSIDCAGAGGLCSAASGACVADPCLSTSNCDAPSRSCSEGILTICEPDIFGCLVETRNDCIRRGSSCNEEGTACVDERGCEEWHQACAAESRMCSENRFYECAPNLYGCLLEDTIACASCSADGTRCLELPCQGDECFDNYAEFEGVIEESDAEYSVRPRNCTELDHSIHESHFDTHVYTNETGEDQIVDIRSRNDFVGYLFLYEEEPDINRPLEGCRESRYGYIGLQDPIIGGIPVAVGESITIVMASASFPPGGPYSISVRDSLIGCGDGVIQEEFADDCDDANTLDGDGCSRSCLVEPGYICTGQPSVCRAIVCGDGVVELDEECDDNNVANGDGCSSTCVVEGAFTCVGEPSSCFGCGDGRVDGDELCDDGNTRSGDGCESDCKSAVFNGSISLSDASWNRPSWMCDSSVPRPNRNYDELTFEYRGPEVGSLSFYVDWEHNTDGYSFVYSTPFSASNPTAHCISGDQETLDVSNNTIAAVPRLYHAVMSGEDQGVTGPWTLTITRTDFECDVPFCR